MKIKRPIALIVMFALLGNLLPEQSQAAIFEENPEPHSLVYSTQALAPFVLNEVEPLLRGHVPVTSRLVDASRSIKIQYRPPKILRWGASLVVLATVLSADLSMPFKLKGQSQTIAVDGNNPNSPLGERLKYLMRTLYWMDIRLDHPTTADAPLRSRLLEERIPVRNAWQDLVFGPRKFDARGVPSLDAAYASQRLAAAEELVQLIQSEDPYMARRAMDVLRQLWTVDPGTRQINVVDYPIFLPYLLEKDGAFRDAILDFATANDDRRSRLLRIVYRDYFRAHFSGDTDQETRYDAILNRLLTPQLLIARAGDIQSGLQNYEEIEALTRFIKLKPKDFIVHSQDEYRNLLIAILKSDTRPYAMEAVAFVQFATPELRAEFWGKANYLMVNPAPYLHEPLQLGPDSTPADIPKSADPFQLLDALRDSANPKMRKAFLERLLAYPNFGLVDGTLAIEPERLQVLVRAPEENEQGSLGLQILLKITDAKLQDIADELIVQYGESLPDSDVKSLSLTRAAEHIPLTSPRRLAALRILNQYEQTTNVGSDLLSELTGEDSALRHEALSMIPRVMAEIPDDEENDDFINWANRALSAAVTARLSGNTEVYQTLTHAIQSGITPSRRKVFDRIFKETTEMELKMEARPFTSGFPQANLSIPHVFKRLNVRYVHIAA